MSGLTYTLIGDGNSDRLLEHPIRWALADLGVVVEQGQWADLRLVGPPRSSLTERAQRALEHYPAELLIVHRDAERVGLEERIQEVRDAVRAVATRHVAIVPVRMTEAWFLHDVKAIRRASGNPSGTAALALPSPDRVESDPDPKATLEQALLAASELPTQRRKKLRTEFPQRRARTAELIDDFGPLKATRGFAAFLSALESALLELGRLGKSA